MIAGELAARRVVGAVLLALCLLAAWPAWPNGKPLVQILQQAGLQMLIVPLWTGAIVVGLMDASTKGCVWHEGLFLTLLLGPLGLGILLILPPKGTHATPSGANRGSVISE